MRRSDLSYCQATSSLGTYIIIFHLVTVFLHQYLPSVVIYTARLSHFCDKFHAVLHLNPDFVISTHLIEKYSSNIYFQNYKAYNLLPLQFEGGSLSIINGISLLIGL